MRINYLRNAKGNPVPVDAFPDVIMPLVVWSLPAVTGFMNWNSN